MSENILCVKNIKKSIWRGACIKRCRFNQLRRARHIVWLVKMDVENSTIIKVNFGVL